MFSEDRHKVIDMYEKLSSHLTRYEDKLKTPTPTKYREIFSKNFMEPFFVMSDWENDGVLSIKRVPS